MSESNAELVAGAAKSELSAGAENDDKEMEVDAQNRSEVKGCPHEEVGRVSEIVEEGAEFGADGKVDDGLVALKKEMSAMKDALIRQQAYLEARQAYIKDSMACLQSLEQQLAVIDKEKSVKVAEVKEESEENIITPDPVKMVFEIPLILEIILGKLDFTSLMSSRTVAKYWDEAALNVFSGELNLDKLFESSDFSPFPEIDPKFTKKIYFEGNCSCDDHNEDDDDDEEEDDEEEDDDEDIACTCNASKQKLLMFFQKFSEQIEEVDFYVCAIFTPTFFKAITNRCPNLTSLHLECYNPTESPEHEAELNEMEAMPHDKLFRMNLKTIEFYNGYGNQPTSFYQKLQRIIDRAPNLTRLELVAYYYPNLTNNKYLKHLCFDGGVDGPNFSQTKLSEMLDQVKDSLEVLEIWTVEEEDSEGPNPQDFTFPCMKVLKQLVILDVCWHPLEQDGRNIIQTIASNFSNLEHLEIKSPEGNGVEMILNKAIQGPLIPLVKIHTLIMDRIQNPSVLALFSHWFPNLKVLTLTIPKDGDIEALFSALGGLKLKHFSFSIEFRFKFSDLVKALSANGELFKELEILEIYADADKGICDDLGIVEVMENGRCKTATQVFCYWLRNKTTKMKAVTFHGFNFSGVTAMEVIPVIVEEQLPVNFTHNQDSSF